MKKQDTFESLLLEFQYHFDIRTAFDDFLTMAICSFGRNPETGLSHDEDLYLKTIEKYKNHDLRHHFPKLLAALTLEMEAAQQAQQCPDILGSFYEVHLYRKGTAQYFTPWPVCVLMASITHSDRVDEKPTNEPLRILDPSCGSGRMLIAGSRNHGAGHHYFSIDIDHTCVKMTALNLFLNGIFFGEVMWANALSPDDFRMSYRLSWKPFGIFRVQDKEQSHLWHLNKNAFDVKRVVTSGTLSSENGKNGRGGGQMELF